MTTLTKPHQIDLELAAAILARDRKATARLVELHADAVQRYIWRRLAPRTDPVDDLVQEVFVAAWKALRTYSGDASLQTWLLGIARNKVEDHYRRTLAAPLESIESEDDATWSVDLPDMTTGLEQEQQAEHAARVLTSLPEAYAAALRWRYWDGRTAREMAAASGRTEKAVERLLARAREQFKARWLEMKGGR
ncbi:MAG: RNA polymerase sigma factor [Acidobacteria bacterium]|nr:RNA polymerase sigma factor [Acidobacteriota bacterium]